MPRRLELRKSPREKVRRAAWILCAEASAAPIPCSIWDLSRTGARLKAANPDTLPDGFRLLMVTGKVERYCVVVWRRNPQMGVRFATQAEAEAAERAGPAPNDAQSKARNYFDVYREEP